LRAADFDAVGKATVERARPWDASPALRAAPLTPVVAKALRATAFGASGEAALEMAYAPFSVAAAHTLAALRPGVREACDHENDGADRNNYFAVRTHRRCLIRVAGPQAEALPYCSS
jgi:hypothetical protein